VFFVAFWLTRWPTCWTRLSALPALFKAELAWPLLELERPLPFDDEPPPPGLDPFDPDPREDPVAD